MEAIARSGLLRRLSNSCSSVIGHASPRSVKTWRIGLVLPRTCNSTLPTPATGNHLCLLRRCIHTNCIKTVTFHPFRPLLLRSEFSSCTAQSSSGAADMKNTGSKVGRGPAAADMEVVYNAPLRGAVRAIKVFSLTTAVAAFFGGPMLVWLGNPSVPVVGRVMMSTVVMLVGLGTTGLLHWLVKGYVMKMEYSRQSGDLFVKTISVLGTMKKHQFHISEAGPPSKATAFSSFQAKGKSFFMHAEVFKDRDLLSKILGAYSVFEEPKIWEDSSSRSSQKD